MNCPLCHEPLAPGERWCDVCGTPAAAPPCPHCGGDVAVAERFCPHCGRPQPTPPPGAHGGVAGGVAPLSITISSGPAAAGGLGRPGVPGDLGPARARPAAALPAPPAAPPAAGVTARPPVPASRPVASAHRWRGGLLGLLVLGLGGGAYALFGPRPEAPAVSATPVSTSRLWVTPARPLPPRAAPGAPASPPAEQPPGLEASQVALAPAASPPDAAPPPAPVTPAAAAAIPPAAPPPRAAEPPPPPAPAVAPPPPVAAPPAAVAPAPTPAQLATARRVRTVLRHAQAAAPAPAAPPAPVDRPSAAPPAPAPPPAAALSPAPPRPEPPRTREILARHLLRAAVTANSPAWDALLAQLRARRAPVTAAQTREARRLLESAPQAATAAQGVERLRAAFAQHPGEPAIAAALVAALQAQQQGAAAETVAMEALGHEPERWENWVTLAQTAAVRDKPAEARAAYRSALRVADAPRPVVARLEALVADRGLDGRIQATARDALAGQTRAP